MQGSEQITNGLIEAGAGAKLALQGNPAMAVIGGVTMVHGFDQAATGARRIYTGEYQHTISSYLLQQTGMSRQKANTWNDYTSVALTSMAFASVQASRLADRYFRLPSSLNKEFYQATQGVSKLWPSSLKGNQVINEIEYVPHALERMPPMD